MESPVENWGFLWPRFDISESEFASIFDIMGMAPGRWLSGRAVASGDRSMVHMWYVYVLKSVINNRLYTGSTNNWQRRFEEHNLGKSKYTRITRPFVLVYREEYKTRLEARRRERFLKTGKGREFLKQILGG